MLAVLAFYLLGNLDGSKQGVNVVTLSTEGLPNGVGLTKAVTLALVGDEVVGAVMLLTVVLGVVVVDMDNL